MGPVDEEYMTVAQAAREAGYRDPRTLRKAAREGRLKTTRVGPFSPLVTTRAWLQEYLASIQQSKSHRGRRRAPAPSADLEDLD
jgi:hypothetical protein